MLQSMNKFSTKVNTVYLFRCFVSKFSKLFISEKVIGRIKYILQQVFCLSCKI